MALLFTCEGNTYSAELINSELKCLDRWLKSNKISINADKTKYMLFSYNINVNFPDISVGNDTINETSVTKFLGIHIDKKINFVNHITEMSVKVAKSIGLLYKLNHFIPETILKTLYTSLIHPYLSYGIEQGFLTRGEFLPGGDGRAPGGEWKARKSNISMSNTSIFSILSIL